MFEWDFARSPLALPKGAGQQYIRPAIWRRIEVEGTESLRKLHHILQAAFGWSDAHRHDFLIDDDTYAQLDIDAGLEFMDLDRTLDDRKAKVHKVLRPGSRMLYRYDFGDGWDHDIVVEKIETIDREPWGVAQVIDGARACPPEDVGGPPGYEVFLTALLDNPDSEVTCPENFVPIRSRDNGSSAQMRSWHEKKPVQRRTDCADTA